MLPPKCPPHGLNDRPSNPPLPLNRALPLLPPPSPQASSSQNGGQIPTERAACQEHFIDLCHLLQEPTLTPTPTGESYAFEKGATKFTGQNGWADVWRRGCFAWESKKKRGDLDAAYRQLLLYAGPLGNVPLLITSDIAQIIIRTNFTNAVTETHSIPLADLANPLPPPPAQMAPAGRLLSKRLVAIAPLR